MDWNQALISSFADEISDDLDAQMEALAAHGVCNIELRTPLGYGNRLLRY